MSVTVYPRLRELLAARQLTVAELERQIEQQYDVPVDRKALHRLTNPALPVQRADMEIAGAVVSVLGVTLADLFDVSAISTDEPARRYQPHLSAEESKRLVRLFGHQHRGRLTPTESAELDGLLLKFEHRQFEAAVRRIAESRGVPVEEIQRETKIAVAAAQEWLEEYERNPAVRAALIAEFRAREASQRAV